MEIFDIDPDITKAKTLSSDFYTDPAHFVVSREKIFARAWHFLGHKPVSDGVTPKTILPDFLDEPVLLVSREDSLKCLSNVCTHRGKILVEEPCQLNLIRCGYHGRRFSLDGKFMSMPEFEGVENFPCESDDLRQLHVAKWSGFAFVALEPSAGFDEFVSFPEDDTEQMHFAGTRVYQVNAHWALYCENYLEGFHIPYVHHGLNAVVDYGTYKTELQRFSSLQTGYDNAGKVAAKYLFVFPNLMFNFYPWGLSVNVVRPITPAKTIVEFLTYVKDGSLLKSGAGADLHGVEMEDEAVVESVQKGIRSRFYTHGRYSPTRETGTHHFHRLIAEFMNSDSK